MNEIKIDFQIEHEPGLIYGDALYLPADHTFTEEQIEAMKQERYQAWVALITGADQPQE